MADLSDQTFWRIADLMYNTIGLSFTDNKKSLVSSRLGPRIQRLGLESFDEYMARIEAEDDGGEFQMAVDLLTTNETYFFREPAHFELLEGEMRRERPRSLTVWSAACSFGDEPYSIAMLLADLQLQGVIGSAWSVLGTDISDRVLRSAIAGIVPEDRLRAVSAERLRRYCLRGDGADEGKSMLRPELRARVRFGRLNLCQPIDDIGPFDVLFLRNVMIYFDAETKSEVVDRVLTRLRPGGLMFIGTAEGRIPCRTPIQVVAPGAFRKVAG